MNQSECLYCGAVRPAQAGVCGVCGSPFASPAAANAQRNEFHDGAFSSASAPRVAACPNCRQPIPPGFQNCGGCSVVSLKSDKPNLKYFSVKYFAIFATLLFFGGLIYYFAVPLTPARVFEQYAAATGADDSLVYENYALHGKGVITQNKLNQAPDVIDVTFEFVYEKPNKFSLEYNGMNAAGSQSAPQFYLKRVYTGAGGSEYMFYAGRNWVYELFPEDAANQEYMLGIPEFATAELKNIDCRAPANSVNPACSQRAYTVESQNYALSPGDFNVIEAKYKNVSDKRRDVTLYFDKSSGFLVMQAQKLRFNKTEASTFTVFKKYGKFAARGRNFWGKIQKTDIYLPSEIEVHMTNNAGFIMTLTITINGVEFDQTIDPKVYTVPNISEG